MAESVAFFLCPEIQQKKENGATNTGVLHILALQILLSSLPLMQSCAFASWVSQWLTFSASSSRPNRGASACHEQMVQRPRLRSTSNISVSGERQGAVTRVEGPLPYIPEWKRAKTKSKLVISPSVAEGEVTQL